MAIEFIGAIIRYSMEEEFVKQVEETNYKLDKNIKKWIKKVDENISLFLDADIKLLIHDFEGCSFSLWDLILEENIKEPKEFIDYIENMSGDHFIRHCFNEYSLKDVNKEITFESEDEVIFKAIKEVKGEKEAKLFIQFKKSPDEVKKRIHNLLEEFYNKFFKDYEDEINNIMEKKVIEHNKRLKDNPKEFLEVISFGDFSKLLKEKGSLKIYICYLVELSLVLNDLSKNPTIIYGFGFEQRFDEKIIKENSKGLFKALSDEKRLEILRLIGRRKWYSNELAKHFGLTSATMSYHMTKLLDIGIVTFETGEQNKLFYKINEEKVKELFDLALKDILGK